MATRKDEYMHRIAFLCQAEDASPERFGGILDEVAKQMGVTQLERDKWFDEFLRGFGAGARAHSARTPCKGRARRPRTRAT